MHFGVKKICKLSVSSCVEIVPCIRPTNMAEKNEACCQECKVFSQSGGPVCLYLRLCYASLHFGKCSETVI